MKAHPAGRYDLVGEDGTRGVTAYGPSSPKTSVSVTAGVIAVPPVGIARGRPFAIVVAAAAAKMDAGVSVTYADGEA